MRILRLRSIALLTILAIVFFGFSNLPRAKATGNSSLSFSPSTRSIVVGASTTLDAVGNGGMGQSPVKFIGIRVAGFDQGLAHILVHYRNNELGDGIQPDSMLLATHVEKIWQKLDALEVQSGAQIVKGDMAVNELTNGPVIVLGGGASSPASPALDLGQIAPYAAAALGALVVIGLAVFFLAGRRR